MIFLQRKVAPWGREPASEKKRERKQKKKKEFFFFASFKIRSAIFSLISVLWLS